MADYRPDTTKDLMFKLDANKNTITVNGPARYKQIITMLFNMVPGMDEYNPDKGLNIAAKLFSPSVDNERDTEYENEITRQFNSYTDLVLTNVVAMGIKGSYCVFFNVDTPTGAYQALLNNNPTELRLLLVNQTESITSTR